MIARAWQGSACRSNTAMHTTLPFWMTPIQIIRRCAPGMHDPRHTIPRVCAHLRAQLNTTPLTIAALDAEIHTLTAALGALRATPDRYRDTIESLPTADMQALGLRFVEAICASGASRPSDRFGHRLCVALLLLTMSDAADTAAEIAVELGRPWAEANPLQFVYASVLYAIATRYTPTAADVVQHIVEGRSYVQSLSFGEIACLVWLVQATRHEASADNELDSLFLDVLPLRADDFECFIDYGPLETARRKRTI
jgi:hypothetical protein